MLTVLVTLVIVGLALLAILWVGTLWAQGYFYDSPTSGLSWRAPAAAGALTLFYLLWAVIEYRRPNVTDTIFRFSTQRSTEFDRFISIRKGPEGEQEIVFHKVQQGPNRFDFRDDQGRVWARSSSGMMVAILVDETVIEDGEEKVVRRRFNAEMTPDGKFNPRAAGDVTMALRYIEEGGDRFIVENQLGTMYSYRRSLLIYNILINLIHFLIWFVILWLLLQFQWPHALLFAVAAWLAVTIALVPYVLSKSREAAERKAARPTAALALPAIDHV